MLLRNFGRIVQFDPPVQTEHVGPTGCAQFQQRRAVVGKVDDRHIGHLAQIGDDGLHIGQGETFKIAGREHTRPRVENL